MSNRYKGAIISATPPTTTGGESGVASGAWTLEQQMQLQAAGLWPSQPPPPYIENVFSTWLYTGNGATNQTITNGINLSGKGGLVWIKNRPTTPSHFLSDSGSSFASYMSSNATTANTSCSSFFAATTSGFTLTGAGGGLTNNTGDGYVSWTFREQPKFFDIVTYTGTGVARTVAHNLGSVPGCIIVKETGSANDWLVYHRSLGNGSYITLNSTGASDISSTRWNDTTPTSTVFTVGTNNGVNANGATYVAYLFAHDAGGFGLTETDNVISCGTYTGNGTAGLAVTLGYESQWVLIKQSSAAGNDWIMYDQLRGMSDSSGRLLYANSSYQEQAVSYVIPNATGFTLNTASTAVNGSGSTYIYIAIRRGPMKVPTTGTSVFSPLAVNNATGTVNTTNFPIDLQMQFYRPGGISPGTSQWIDRLRGFSSTSTDSGTRLYTTGTEAEAATAIGTLFNNTGFSTGASWASVSMSYNNFRRAPSFFDEVCWTANGAAQNISHNLTVAPELIIFKGRSVANNWYVGTNFTSTTYMGLYLDATNAGTTGAYDNAINAQPTAAVFRPGSNLVTSGNTVVTYLFATCAGVSKVGSYTGTGTTQTINCGFTAGSRFIMIKRTDSTGAWYVWDSARGIIAGNDPYLLWNSTAAEVTGTDYVDTAASGFEISSTAPAAINANGGTYIFLAIA